MLLRIAVLSTVGLIAGSAAAAEIALRERCLPAGPVVRLGDLADVAAAGPAELDELITTPLAPAPAPGVVRYLRASEVRDLLVLRGVDVSRLRFGGAPGVEIGSAPESATSSVPLVRTNDVEAVKAEVEQRIVEYLVAKTGHDLWRVEATGDAQFWSVLSFAAAEARVAGGDAPWTGRQKFLLAARAGDAPTAVLTRVTRQELVVVAQRPIARGELIRAADVEIQPVDNAVPAAAVRNLAEVVGKESATNIAVGTMVMSGAVRAPIVVRRGELVTVTARTGGITARTVAVAQQDGAAGELVLVESGAKQRKRRFTARVTGYRELEVFVAPAAAAEFAQR
ncbi:MAG: flagellar basal body P-ring formation protein FlgA [Pirellulales bacterium]|nr:flagellar basal body P-ring formation protein FlgA [Pirellulales bacterium]